MNRRRSTVIALQTAVVAAVALIVVLTLLQPDGGDPLFDVSTPEDAGSVELRQDPRDRGGRDRDDNRRDGDTRRGNRGKPPLALVGPGASASAAGSGAGAAAAPISPLGSIPAPANSGDGDDDGSPTGDQYSDALARLSAKLD